MGYLAVVVALVVTASSIAIHLLIRAKKTQPANLPPGSLGLPVIGQSLGLLQAMRGDGGSRWIQDRIDRYGPVSKLSLFGTPTVLLAGLAANKFMFFSSALSTRQPRSVQRILEENWAGRATVTVLPLMKRLTFDIISALLFGLERGAVRDALAGDFVRMIEGMWAIPANLPFTAFSRSLKASGRARRVLEGITGEKKAKQLEHGKASRNNDLITCLLSLRDGHGERMLTDEEIVDNAMVALIAGHDTSSILMTFMVRHLANDDATLAAMVQGK